MQLNKLYEIQAGLKAHIDYKGEDKFSRMMLAMIVEFGECANGWQQFKYWKKNNDPKETLLEEYVDGLHFILEAGLDLVELGLMRTLPDKMYPIFRPVEPDITKQFKQVIWQAMQLDVSTLNKLQSAAQYHRLFGEYVALGYMLGFADEQIENAYMEKNKENHERQQRNY